MGRLVEHDATGPRKLDKSDIDPENGDIAVCRCGLSAAFPFCDGTHNRIDGEEDELCYRYVREDGELRRREVERVVYTDDTAKEE